MTARARRIIRARLGYSQTVMPLTLPSGDCPNQGEPRRIWEELARLCRLVLPRRACYKARGVGGV